jgi:hypothetical protein
MRELYGFRAMRASPHAHLIKSSSKSPICAFCAFRNHQASFLQPQPFHRIAAKRKKKEPFGDSSSRGRVPKYDSLSSSGNTHT